MSVPQESIWVLGIYGTLVITLVILFVSLVSGWLTFEVTFVFFIKPNESVCAADAIMSLSELDIVWYAVRK